MRETRSIMLRCLAVSKAIARRKPSAPLARTILFGASALASVSVAAQEAESTPVLPAERSDVAVLSAAGPHRIFNFSPFGGGGVILFEGDDPAIKSLGNVPATDNAAVALPRDASKIYLAETYWSHGNRGERSEILSVYDAQTLDLESEIPIPGHLHVVPKMSQMGLSDDDSLAYIYALVPSSSVHVVDLAKESLATTIEIPGCALVYPYGPRSFATVCGDGTIGSVTLDDDNGSSIRFSERMFDPDNDPVLENSIVDRSTGEGFFLTYTGKILSVPLGEGPISGETWSIQEAAGMEAPGTGVQELAWRPGGNQLMALHRDTGRIYVLMHPGNHWTHKVAGTEIWVLDAHEHKLLRRIPLDTPATSVAVSQGEDPLLYVFGFEGDGPGGLEVRDATTGEVLRGRGWPGFGNVFVPGN
tara:strand:- start:69067 stop:70317 length:1251 start_codon:yes stop_codon:yes gene_type:complete